MTTDDRVEPPEQPEGKATTRLEQVPAWAVALTKSVTNGFTEVNVALEALKGTDKTLTDAMAELDTEFRDMRTRQRSAEDDLRRLSMRTKGTADDTTTAGLEQAAQLAQERAAREALAKEHAETKADVAAIKKDVSETKEEMGEQTAMLGKIAGILDKPMVKRIGYAAGGLLLAALTAATGYLARGNVQPPQPTIIQVPAPLPPILRGAQ